MRKLQLILLSTAVAAMAFFSSCETVDGDQSPLLTLTTVGLGANNTITEGDTFTVSVTAAENPESKSKLEDLVIAQPGTDTTVAINASSYQGTFTYIAPAAGTTESYVLTLTDKAGETAAQTLNVTGEAGVTSTPLGSAMAFTMERCGSNNDPEQFGLQFDQVTGSTGSFEAVIVTSTADKMVELMSSEWTSITTVEGLTAAVDGGTASTTFSLSLGGAVDKVVATKEGSTYTLIHFTNAADPVPCAAGSQVTLTGESKQ